MMFECPARCCTVWIGNFFAQLVMQDRLKSCGVKKSTFALLQIPLSDRIRLTTGYDGIHKKLVEMRRTFTNFSIKITFTNFEKLDKPKLEQLMTNSKHSRKYNLSQDKIKSMVLFQLYAALLPQGNNPRLLVATYHLVA